MEESLEVSEILQEAAEKIWDHDGYSCVYIYNALSRAENCSVSGIVHAYEAIYKDPRCDRLMWLQEQGRKYAHYSVTEPGKLQETRIWMLLLAAEMARTGDFF